MYLRRPAFPSVWVPLSVSLSGSPPPHSEWLPRSSELSFRLASLPAYPEPAPLDDPPYVTAVLESGEELEYAICGGKELGVSPAQRPVGFRCVAVSQPFFSQ